MPKNFVQPGRSLSVAAPVDCLSGDLIVVGAAFGIAATNAAAGSPVELLLGGVWTLKKKASQAWTLGAKVYWDAVAKELTTTATDNLAAGVAVAAVGGTAGETLGRVRLNAAF